MINMVLTLFMFEKSCSFFIQRGKNSDIVSGNPEYCSGSTFCQCINSTFLDFDSNINCGNQLEACRLVIEGKKVGVYTAIGMSSYNLILTTENDDLVCTTEPIPVPIFVHDYQNIMVWNPIYNTLLQNSFSASIKDLSKVELKIKHHLQGLLLKVFINCDNKEQCIAIKFEGIQEYPLDAALLSKALGLDSTLATSSLATKTFPTTTRTSVSTSSTINVKLSTLKVPIGFSQYNTRYNTRSHVSDLLPSAFDLNSTLATPSLATKTPVSVSSTKNINLSTIIASISFSQYNTRYNNKSHVSDLLPSAFDLNSTLATPSLATKTPVSVPSTKNINLSTIIIGFSPYSATFQTYNATDFTNNITISIQDTNQFYSNSTNAASSLVVSITSIITQLYSTDDFIKPTTETASKFPDIETYLATLVTLSSSTYIENTTRNPPKNDAILTTKTYVAQIIIGMSVFLLLLVFLFACFLAYKRKKRKSQFKIPKTYGSAITNITDGSLNNHATMIRMENNSLSTSASIMNAPLRSNPLYHDYYEQESLNGLEDIPIDEQMINDSLNESFNYEKSNFYKRDTKVNNRRLSVIFSHSQSLQSSTVEKDDSQSNHSNFPFAFSIEHGSTPDVKQT